MSLTPLYPEQEPWSLRPLCVIPIFPISIEKRSDTHFVARLWAGHTVEQTLQGFDPEHGFFLVESAREEHCFYFALHTLINNYKTQDENYPKLTDFATHNWLAGQRRIFASLFEEPWQRAAFAHDLDDCILAIDNGALEH